MPAHAESTMSANSERDHSSYMFTAIVLTLLLYVIMLSLAERIYVPNRREVANITQPTRHIELRKIELKDIEPPKPDTHVEPADRLNFREAEKIGKLMPRPNLPSPDKPMPKATANEVLTPSTTAGVGRELMKRPDIASRDKATQSNLPHDLASPPPRILAIDANDLPSTRVDLPGRTVMPSIARQDLLSHNPPGLSADQPGGGGMDSGPGGPGVPQSVPLSMKMQIPKSMPPKLPSSLPPPVAVPTVEQPIDDSDQASDMGSLDDLMTVSVRVYRDPRDQTGYFEVTIRPNEQTDRLKPIPHDILFVLDSSASMTQEYLDNFKKALIACLPLLRPEDRFNIAVFRDKPKPLFSDWHSPTPEALKEAITFVNRQVAVGTTDVYAGVAPYVTLDRADPGRPYLIFLVTDGKTTTGESLANNEFIRAITRDNKADASIFALSGGSNTNLFLLEFLSYSNRGVSLHMEDMDNASTRGQTYVSKLSEIIVANPECFFTGELNQDVYPKKLPHLYRQFPLKIYGRLPRDTHELAVQVIGTSFNGKAEELLVHQDLDKAEPAGEELAKLWAGQKIYYLTNEWIRTHDGTIRTEAYRLAAKYNVVVPF